MIIKVFLFLLYCKSIFLSLIICIIIYMYRYICYIIIILLYHMIHACLFFKCCRLVSYITSIALYILCIIITVACYHFRLIFVINKVLCIAYADYFLYYNIYEITSWLSESVDFSGSINCIPLCIEACYAGHQWFWMLHKCTIAK